MESNVRRILEIPYNPSVAAKRYEHSMGQFGGKLPAEILKKSSGVLQPKPQVNSLDWIELRKIGNIPASPKVVDSREFPTVD